MTAQIELTHFAPQTRRFLIDLAANNNRDWFRRNKLRYDSEVRRPAERLVDRLSERLAAATGRSVRGKLFRPHRDVRFSDDKTPFYTHLHAAWTLPGGRSWYFGLSADYATAGAGVMTFDEDQTVAWRHSVAGVSGEALAALLERLDARLDPATLDEVPAPYPATHPRADLLRRCGCVAWYDELFEALAEDPEATLTQTFERLSPLQDWLARHL
ncbi:TIGR02453 family protein [Salipiger bermudensis]|uniref:TIGR02453 family protein n=1 Tax=Salipiger bermudensis TaxID=344736 RepID=UPI001A8E17D2|nr:TIGR02453 family protein [Salipiger bermudensis]MBN9675942.1 TIGR02453 family protein [Salipiger bermudensis]